MARFAMCSLRIYLIVLLTLIAVKFVRTFSSAAKNAQPIERKAAPTP
jgi:hypothetical protein